MSNIAIVEAFCAAWSTRDADAIAALVTEDCFYHNVPIAPVEGRAAVAEFIRTFLANVVTAEFDILAIAETADGVVLTERVDRFDYGGARVDLPVMGSFHVRDGLIARWLDYFDMAPFAALQGG